MGITEPLGWLAAPNAMIRSSRLTNGTLAATLSTVPSTFPSGIPLLLPDAADARFCSRLVTVVLVVPLREPARPFSTLDSRSEEHTSELQSLMRISYAVFCLKTKIIKHRFIPDNEI